MPRELKTWVWQCSTCRELSNPVMSIYEPTTPPAGWEHALVPHCEDCYHKDEVDRCPDCLIRKANGEVIR
jgi:predicted RNA-binding Zn-ribbon protein involved in translation (DUF1610 family)